MLLYNSLSHILPKTGSQEMRRQFFSSYLLPFLNTETTLVFLHSENNFLNMTENVYLVVCKQIQHKFSTFRYSSYCDSELCLVGVPHYFQNITCRNFNLKIEIGTFFSKNCMNFHVIKKRILLLCYQKKRLISSSRLLLFFIIFSIKRDLVQKKR